MADYDKPVIHGITAAGDKKAVLVGSDGGLGISIEGGVTVDNGTPITGQSLPSGTGLIGWLSNIYAFISSRLPALVGGKIPVDAAVTITGISTEAKQDNQITLIGGVTETAPDSDTASSGLNGRVQRVAQRITSLITLLPTSLGTKTAANSFSVTLSSDGATQAVSIAVAPSGLAYVASTLVTRLANVTAYTANDVYGGAFELTNIGASDGFIFIESLDIIFNIAALPSGMGSFTLYLYSATPPSAIADNVAFSLSSGDRASILNPKGITLSASLAQGGSSVVAEIRNLNQLYKLTGTSLFGYLVTAGAFTPAANSETFTVRARTFTP
jgi:hypothetical protein